MKQTLWNGIARGIRHGLAPIAAYLVAKQGVDEGSANQFVEAVVVIGGILFGIAWSMARTAFPAIRLLG
jgi:hypothetical protein